MVSSLQQHYTYTMYNTVESHLTITPEIKNTWTGAVIASYTKVHTSHLGAMFKGCPLQLARVPLYMYMYIKACTESITQYTYNNIQIKGTKLSKSDDTIIMYIYMYMYMYMYMYNQH